MVKGTLEFDDRIRDVAFRAWNPGRPYQDVPGSYAKRHKYFRDCRLKGSAMWILQQPEYLHWLYDDEYDIFCCTGPRGVGKSVIA